MPPLYLVLATHTTRHLRRTLLGAAVQSRRADLTVVSCDNDNADIAELVRAASAEFDLPITLAQRPKGEVARPNQVRNNGVRAILRQRPGTDGHVIFFDGDCCPAFETLARHQELVARGELIVGYRIDLTEAQTQDFDEGALRDHRPPAVIDAGTLAALQARHARYVRQLRLRRFGLAKAHKPKVLGANFSVSLAKFVEVNGLDEQFSGYGGEDDDFGRRVYRSGGRGVVGVNETVVYHQWHPTRKPELWHQGSGIARFKQTLPVRCERGLDHPVDQGPLVIRRYGSGRLIEEMREDGAKPPPAEERAAKPLRAVTS